MVKLTEDLLLMQSSSESSISISESSNCPSISSTAETNTLSNFCSREQTAVSSYRRINCWGSEIDDISIIAQMPDLEVVTLSSNAVEDLSPFANCKGLTQLTLRKNNVSDMKQLEHLQQLDCLRTLWLMDNPVADQPNYRQKVIQLLPQLNKLDRQLITDKERRQAVEGSAGDVTESCPHKFDEGDDGDKCPPQQPKTDEIKEAKSQPSDDTLTEVKEPSRESTDKQNEEAEKIDSLEQKPVVPSVEIVRDNEPVAASDTCVQDSSGSSSNRASEQINQEETKIDRDVPLNCLVADCGQELAQTSTMAASQEVKIMGPKLYSAPVSGMMFAPDENEDSSHQQSELSPINQLKEEEEVEEISNRDRTSAFRDARSNTVQAIELLLDNVTHEDLRHLLTVISSKLNINCS